MIPDPDHVRHVVTRTLGWIEALRVKSTGEFVHEGQPLFTLYAPDLVGIQEEYLRYLRSRDAGSRAAGTPEARRRLPDERQATARQRLERYGLPESFIRELEEEGATARPMIVIPAPTTGFVQLNSVFEGQQVEPGMDLMTITDLSEVWIEADLFEADIPRVRVGQGATISLLYDPGVRLTGRIIKINPFLDTATRTMKTWLRCPNEKIALKPGMFVIVELALDSGQGVIVPSSAVLDTGLRKLIFVDAGDGRFEPRSVEVGLRAGDRLQILSGVAAGERVAVRGNFLLDAESRLQRGTAP